MGNSISQLIEIYERELSDLLHRSSMYGDRTDLSSIPIPQKGDGVQLANNQYTIVAIEPFTDANSRSEMSDFLNDEDKKIIDELEKEGDLDSDGDSDGEFDDDPYPDFDRPINADWDIGGEQDNIDLSGDEAGYEEEDREIVWTGPPDEATRETTIAYYRAFHTAGKAFGIYYKRKGLKKKTKLLFAFCRQRGYRITIGQTYIIAKMMTQFHEIFHHKIEAIASRIEVITRQPIYISGFSAWYMRTRKRAACYEETFANIYAYHKTLGALGSFLPKVALHNIMVHWFNHQPIPYRNALKLIQEKEIIRRNKENQFFEIILKKFFPADPRFGKIHANVWTLFTHGSQPYINTKSNVYYII